MSDPLTVEDGLVPLNIPWKVSVHYYLDTLADVLLYRWLPALALSLVFLVIWWALPKLLSTILRRLHIKRHKTIFVCHVFRFAIALFAVYRVLRLLGFDPNYILTFLGLTSWAVSWAMSAIVSNYFAGIMIQALDLVEVNFCIQVQGDVGIVEHCGDHNFILYNATTQQRVKVNNNKVLQNSIVYLNKEESAEVAGPDRLFLYKDFSGHLHYHSPEEAKYKAPRKRSAYDRDRFNSAITSPSLEPSNLNY